jgi:hypothetical protein
VQYFWRKNSIYFQNFTTTQMLLKHIGLAVIASPMDVIDVDE